MPSVSLAAYTVVYNYGIIYDYNVLKFNQSVLRVLCSDLYRGYNSFDLRSLNLTIDGRLLNSQLLN